MAPNMKHEPESRLGFAVEALDRPDDPIRLGLARVLELRGESVADLALLAGVDPRSLWSYLSGRTALRADRLAAILDAAGFRLLAPDEARPLRPGT